MTISRRQVAAGGIGLIASPPLTMPANAQQDGPMRNTAEDS
jgi:hypothetical protein